MMDRKNKISVISVNYNGLDLTCAMIDSLHKNVSYPIEIIVVDNGSKVDEASVLSERYPDVKAVRSEENLGFAGGNNLGVKYATGDYLFFLNNDTEIYEDHLDKIVEDFENSPNLGMVGPKLRFWAGSRPIQFAGYTEMKGIAMKNDLIGFKHEDDGSFDTPAVTPFVHGAAMVVSRKAFEDVGPMPECYFLYFEELDWDLMFTRKGWTLFYEPAQTVFHKESATTGQESPLRSYYMTRNRQLFAYRNYTGVKRMLVIAYARYFSGAKRSLKALLHRRFDIIKAIARGNRDFIKIKNKCCSE